MSQDKPELLLFDDEADTGDIVQDRLSDDFEVTFCTTEAQIRDEIQPDRFCVIACDVSIQNSDKSGYKLIDEIRRDYGIRKVPVVVYSAVRDIPEIRKREGTYYDAYIEKVPPKWGEKLAAACIKACAKEGRWVVADVYEKLLADHLDDLLDVRKFSADADIMEVYGNENLTIKIVLEKLRKKELDKETESVYTKAIENYYEYIVESGKL